MKNFNLSQFLGCCVIGISIVIAGWLISKDLPNTTQLWQVQTIFSAVRNLMNGLKIELSKFQFIEQFIPQNYEFFKRTQKAPPITFLAAEGVFVTGIRGWRECRI